MTSEEVDATFRKRIMLRAQQRIILVGHAIWPGGTGRQRTGRLPL